MTKDVIISITGLQYEVSGGEAIEVISQGEYYYRNNKHFIKYEEVAEEDAAGGKLIQSILKITPERVEMTKKGASNVHMLFELGKSHMTYYSTPYGDLMLGITTRSIEVTEEESLILVTLIYGLDINYEFVSDCTLTIKIRAK